MKFAIVAIAVAGLAGAQVQQLPTCAQTCVNKYTSGTAIAGCSNLDIKCICSNSGFLDGIACCLADACPKADQDTAVKYAKDICTGAGVTVPDQVVCKSANATASGSAAATGASQTASSPSATGTANAAPVMGPGALLGGLFAALFAL
ncbi:hypothetical protein CGLO_11946 [Colletotrichum gloeosporioides Cg-14]|uniref:CFEM domain-containing protein n=1 Tax=Colletotrichum gloeosporioides (strain Cg-14) TaxID=1237896 RepID=T0LAP0_COLGC|nr:hypothetical protein CGLO_11946 [Colletotrichum gloeosporioides Cg-14]